MSVWDSSNWVTDKQGVAPEPPPGVPRLFWEKLLQDPANQEGLHWLTDPTKGGSFDRFGSKQQYLAFLQQSAEEQFKRLPPAQQKQYADADARGDAYDPNSTEGRLAAQDRLIAQQKALGEADYAGLDINDLNDALRGAAAGDSFALSHLNDVLKGIKDPAVAEYVGDYAAHLASPDERDVDAQRRQLAKLEGLSDPRITAEERLMNEMARRQTEADLRGQRGAIKNDLQARGMYGSGAELTMNLAAQQEAASRQALEQLQANANASQRAMTALKGAGDLATSMRGSSAQEGQFNANAMNLADQFNKNLREGYQQWKDRTEKENNDRQIAREEKIAQNVHGIGQAPVMAQSGILANKSTVADKKHQLNKEAFDASVANQDRWIDLAAGDEGEKKIKL